MPPEALPYIWDRFTRVEASRSHASGGNGLGLAIVRKAVESMHGHVAVTSKVGKGSTFSILLPAAWRLLIVNPFGVRHHSLHIPI